MNTPQHIKRILGLDPTDRTRSGQLRLGVTAVTAFATIVQVIVWLLLGIFRSRLDSPWWCWTAASGLVINTALLCLTNIRSYWTTVTNTTTGKESL